MSPWRLELDGRTVRVDVTSGMEPGDWERLLDGILHEIDALDLVVVIARPAVENTVATELLLESLVKNLERRALATRIERAP